MKLKVEVKIIGCLSLVLLMFLSIVGYHSLQPKEEEPVRDEIIDINQELDEQINDYLDTKGISEEDISLYIYDLVNQKEATWNPDAYVTAGSVYKVPLAMIYYEWLSQGDITLQTTLYYDEAYAEEPDDIDEGYEIGTEIALGTLLHDMIVDSNNTAGHILYENLGGWVSFKEMAAVYSDMTYDPIFFSYDNVLSASYMKDVLLYLYEHEFIFQGLIEDMKDSGTKEYLDRIVDVDIAQKYGEYDGAENAVGIVYGKHPYIIVMFTDLGALGKQAIGDINQLCYEYFLGA